MAEREQRLVFGEVADAYQQHRPSYPDELYDAIRELSGVVPGDPVLDVGAGTGKVTEALAARGYATTAVEPSPEMAAVLEQRLPSIRVVRSGFEECDLEPRSFALITAGQSWHWVRLEEGTRKAHELLRAGGWLALFWNAAALDGCDWHDALQPVYLRIAPELAHENLAPAQDAGVRDRLAELRSGKLFENVTTRHVAWNRQYTSEAYVALLATHSSHRLLPEQQRLELHRAIAASIDARGGLIDHPYTTDLVAARVK